MHYLNKLILVNKDNKISDTYMPNLTLLKNSTIYVDKCIINDLYNMFDDAQKNGYKLIVCSGYRSIDYQSQLFHKKISVILKSNPSYSHAIKEAATVVMPPGYSEHHTGLAVDIVSENNLLLEEEQENTPENIWLQNNCYKYGFILRYPKNKEEITKVIYEPWHFRYVGKEMALHLTINNLTLEEFTSQTLL